MMAIRPALFFRGSIVGVARKAIYGRGGHEFEGRAMSALHFYAAVAVFATLSAANADSLDPDLIIKSRRRSSFWPRTINSLSTGLMIRS